MIRTFDICKHIPSNKYYFVRYCIPDYSLNSGYKTNEEETNFWLWSVMPEFVGGVYGGKVMKIVCKRFSFEWFYYSTIILIKSFYSILLNKYRCYKINKEIRLTNG